MTSDASADIDGLPDRPRRWVMLCLLLGVMLANLDSALANIALPTIARELHADLSSTIWVVNGYQLAVAVCLLPFASLGEIIGAKLVYTIGLAVFAAASLGCALSPTLNVLIGARLMQGIGGACLAGLGPALVREIFPRRKISSGLAQIALVVAVSGVCGPPAAALILTVASWPWLFLVNLPICAIAVPLFISVAPRSQSRPRPFDMVGALLNAAALGLVVVGVDGLGTHGRFVAGAEIGTGLAAVAVLILQQRRRTLPLLPLDLLRIPLFSLSIVTSVCSYSAQILAYVSLPILFETAMSRSQTATGLLLTPWPLMVAIAAPVAGHLSQRYTSAILGTIGLVLLTFGLVLLATMPSSAPTWDIVWRMGVCGIGFGFFQTPNNMALMTAGPPTRGGSASGMVAVARTIGWSLGAALVSLLLSAPSSYGPRLCLITGAAFATCGLLVSSARAFTRRTQAVATNVTGATSG